MPGPSQYPYSNYPLVTTGGANTAAVASANFFIESPLCHDHISLGVLLEGL